MRRREFIAGLGGVAALTVSGYAQERSAMRRVGILIGSVDNPEIRSRVTTFLTELQNLGWTDGSNISIDLRWGGPDPTAEARGLVQLKPDVIVAGPTNAYLPAQRQTRTIPIVFVGVSDPLGQGFVKSLARPEGNATGFSNLEFSLIGKWIQLLKEAVPGLRRVGLMISTSNASSPRWYQVFGEVAPTFNVEPLPLPLENATRLESLVASVARDARSALIVTGDSVIEEPGNRRQVLALTALHRVPTLYGVGTFAEEGGFITYGIDRLDPYRRAASYVDRILKGEKPGDLPVQAPNKFKFTINLKTAKALGLELSPTFVGTADEVIE